MTDQTNYLGRIATRSPRTSPSIWRGLKPILAAVFAHLPKSRILRRRPRHRARGAPDLTNHLRRDIGLPPLLDRRTSWRDYR